MPRREQLEEMLKADPDDPFLAYALANEELKAGETEPGLARLRGLVARHPDYVPAWFRQGQVLAEEGRTEEARAALQEGVGVARRVGDSHAEAEMSGFLEML